MEDSPEDLSYLQDVIPESEHRQAEGRRWISVGSHSQMPLSSVGDDVDDAYKGAFVNLRAKLVQRVHFDADIDHGRWTIPETTVVSSVDKSDGIGFHAEIILVNSL